MFFFILSGVSLGILLRKPGNAAQCQNALLWLKVEKKSFHDAL
jgi:hypothetical protein